MSAINTGSINSNYPTPGVNNSSQGFRDNFSSIKNNLDTAGSEITELQNKAVLKSALNGRVLDNDMNNTLISNALTKGFRSTTLNLGNDITGNIDIDFNKADVHFGTITGPINLKFINWPKAGTHAKMQMIFNIGVSNATITFPESLDQSSLTLENKIDNNSPTVTVSIPANVNSVHYIVSTENCGETITIVPVNRPRKSTQIINGEPTYELREYSGVITTELSERDVHGINSLFATELVVGKKLFDQNNNEIGTINNIFSNTLLRLVEPAKIAITEEVYKTQFYMGTVGDKLGTVFAKQDSIAICIKDYDGTSEIWDHISFNSVGAIAAVSSVKVSGGLTGLTFTPDQPITSYGEFVMSGILSPEYGGTGSNDLTGFLYAPGNNENYISYDKIPGNMLSGVVPVINGGTGASDKETGLKNLLPDLVGNFGEYLRTDGVNVYWDTVVIDIPIASDTVLGGFRVGDGLSINDTSGIMTLAPSTTTIIGGVISDGVTTSVSTQGILSVSVPGLLSIQPGAAGKYLRTDGVGIEWSDLVIPYATTTSVGVVRVDGTSTIIDPLTGILSSVYVLPTASTSVLGGIKVDNNTLEIDQDGYLSIKEPLVEIASADRLGVVKVDGTTIHADPSGRISVNFEDVSWDDLFQNYQELNYTLPIATTTTVGGVKVDGSTITVDGTGTISSPGLVGEIKMWPSSSPPLGYFICNGQSLNTAQYPKLYAIIGTTYGGSGGTFNLPNFTNRMPVGAGDLYGVGSIGGSKDAVVVSHTHTVNDPGHSHLTDAGTDQGPGGPGEGQPNNNLILPSSVSTTGISVNATGQSGTNANLPPYLGISFIIKHD